MHPNIDNDIVVCDLDGVAVNLMDALAEVLFEERGVLLPVSGISSHDLLQSQLTEILTESDLNRAIELFYERAPFERARPHWWMVRHLQAFLELGGHVIFLTARATHLEEPTVNWLKRYRLLGRGLKSELVMSSAKGLKVKNLILDRQRPDLVIHIFEDSPKNLRDITLCMDALQGVGNTYFHYRTYMPRRPWNHALERRKHHIEGHPSLRVYIDSEIPRIFDLGG